MREGCECGCDYRGKEAEYELVEGVFAGPAKSEAGEGDADLGDREKFFRLREEGERDFGAGETFFGKAAEPGIADGEERDFGASEKGVDCEY